MSLMLSELIDSACTILEEYGDMPVWIDSNLFSDFECAAIEMRREIDIKTKKYNFVVADYIYKVNQLRLVK